MRAGWYFGLCYLLSALFCNESWLLEVSPRRRETDVKWRLVPRAPPPWVQEGGSLVHPTEVLPVPPQSWRFAPPVSSSKPSPLPPAYPDQPEWRWLTVIRLWMMFYGLVLKSMGLVWTQWNRVCTKLVMLDQFPWSLDSFQDSYDPDNPAPPPIKPRKLRQGRWTTKNRNKQLLLTAFLALSRISQACHHQPFNLKSESQLQQTLRSYRAYTGVLQTDHVPELALQHLQQVIKLSHESFISALGGNKGVITLTVDTGASFSCTNNKADIKPGTLVQLAKPVTLGGIAGGLQIEYKGIACWETIDDYGNIVPIECEVYLHEELPCRLLSPQAFLTHSSQRLNDHFKVFSDRTEWHQFGRKLLTIPYDKSFLPRIVVFQEGSAEESLHAFNTEITGQANTNLTAQQKTWLRWHCKLGHLGFYHTLKLALGGYLDKLALSIGRDTTPPKCTSCLYAKQTRVHHEMTTTTKNPEKIGNLKAGILKPGARVFCDQLESHLKGRRLHTAGREPDRDKFCGSTLFCDAASNLLHAEHQVTLSANETINSKINFERKAKEMGVSIDEYHTDNGIFKSKDFMAEIRNNDQGIRFSGVGAKWQNGAAE